MRDAKHISEASRPLATFVAVDPESLPMGTAPNYAFRYIDIASATQGRLLLPDDEIEYRDAPSRARRVLRNQDVIMSTVRPNLKAFAYCRLPTGNFVASTGFAVLRAKESTDPRFILYSILSNDVTRQIERFVVGSNYPAINSADVMRLSIPNLSPGEQERIGEILSTVDEAIEQTQALIVKVQQIKAGLMHDLFTRGVTADGQLRPPREEAPQLYKQSPLGWIPKEWDVESLASIGTWTSGGTPAKVQTTFWGGDLPWVTPKDMKVFRLQSTYDTLTPDGAAAGSRVVPKDSVFVVVRGMILAHTFPVCLASAPMAFNQDVKALVPGALVSGEFLAHWFVTSKYHMLGLVTEATHGTKRIDMRDMLRSYIGVPPGREQEAVVCILNEFDTELETERADVLKLRDMKAGLMSDLLTGRVPVSVENPTGPKEVAANV